MTTPEAVQTSINDLAETRFEVLNQHHSFAAPILGTGQPLQNTNSVSVFGSAGSLSAGGHARYATSSGIAVLAGVAYSEETYPSAKLDSSITGALALRWLDPSNNIIRPYVEPLTPNNPFEAHFSSGTDQADLARFGASFSAELSNRIDSTLWITASRTLSTRSSVSATILAMGTVPATQTQQPNWIEFGGRIGYRVTEATFIDAFVNSVNGVSQHDTFTHIGAALRAHF